ncbi:MAG: UMP kinase [Candidatus Pacearchaeota archaeon]|jgi:uridylate kinase
MKKVIVISLGGSVIVPDKINEKNLEEFKKIIKKNVNKYKFVIVCGGGKTARVYINGLENQQIKKKKYLQSLLGIASTRFNSRFMTYFFGKESNKGIPNDMKDIENLLKIHNIIFCGALRYTKNETSDAVAARLANHFKTTFINITDVKGLYDKDPKKFKNAKFIHEISYEKFLDLIKKKKFELGQHFVLDIKAAKIIKKNQIKTCIISSNANNLDNLLNEKHFEGTIIGT